MANIEGYIESARDHIIGAGTRRNIRDLEPSWRKMRISFIPIPLGQCMQHP